jgi:DNA polymerase III delta prime subunit
MNNYIREKAELLKKVHNLVFTGAPGTGKTYLAQQIAREILNENKKTSNSKSTEIIDWAKRYDETEMVEFDWTSYSRYVQAFPQFEDGIKVIRRIRKLFITGKHFSEFLTKDRKYIAATLGEKPKEEFDYEDSNYFGSMFPRGDFKKAINENNQKYNQAYSGNHYFFRF